MQIDKVKVFPLPKIYDERGNLSYFEDNRFFPFETGWASWIVENFAREFAMDDVYTNMSQVIVIFSGSIDLILREGDVEKRVTLNSECNCIYLPSLIFYRILSCTYKTAAFIASNKLTEALPDTKNVIQNKKMFHENYQLHH
jgi:hypothetical protein